MTNQELKSKSKDEVLKFIREKLSLDPHIRFGLKTAKGMQVEHEHFRFDMSGYDWTPGSCTVHNLMVLNNFAHLGIYDYTDYLFLDFYKGIGTLYIRYWNGNQPEEHDFSGYGTAEIIYEIFQLTIFSDKPTRRRS